MHTTPAGTLPVRRSNDRRGKGGGAESEKKSPRHSDSEKATTVDEDEVALSQCLFCRRIFVAEEEEWASENGRRTKNGKWVTKSIVVR